MLLFLFRCTEKGFENRADNGEDHELPVLDLNAVDACYRNKLELKQKEIEAALAEHDPANRRVADDLGEMGMLLHSVGLVQQAGAFYERAASMAPGDFRWHYYSARVFQSLLALDRAKESFRLALEHNDGYVPALVELGEAYRKEGRLDDAETLFQRALALDSDCVAAMIRLAQIANLKKNYGAAVSLLDAAFQRQPQAAPAHYTAALSYRGLGNLEKAEFHIRERDRIGKPLQIKDPLMDAVYALISDPEENFSCGERALDEGKPAEAARHFEIAAAARPDELRYRTKWAWALIRSGNKAAALEVYRDLVRLRPRDPNPRFNLGGLLLDLGRPGEAATVFGELAVMLPNLGPPYFFKAESLRLAGSNPEALTAYREAIARDPEHAGARAGRALMLARLGEFEAAAANLAEDLKIFPHDPVLGHILVRILATCPGGSCSNGSKAALLIKDLRSDPLDFNLAETTAMVMAANGDFEKAVQWQQNAITQSRESRDPEQIKSMVRQLEEYRNRKPCQLPWLADDPVFNKKSYRFP